MHRKRLQILVKGHVRYEKKEEYQKYNEKSEKKINENEKSIST